MTKKIFIIIVIVAVIVIGAIIFANRNNIKSPLPPLTTDELTVPEYVSVFLASSVENNERVPVLILSVVAGGGCDSASNLETRKSLNGDTLVVDIKGYKFTKGTGEVCPAISLELRTKISVDPGWLKQSENKEIVFKLGGQDNRYKISYSKDQVTLSGIQATNVITNRPGYNPSETPITLEMTLYPTDVAIMYLAGSVSSAKDYRPAMRDFARAKGFIPVGEVYSGLEQNEKSQFYVVLKNHPIPEPNRSESLGELPGEGVGVYLKQIASDAEHY